MNDQNPAPLKAVPTPAKRETKEETLKATSKAKTPVEFFTTLDEVFESVLKETIAERPRPAELVLKLERDFNSYGETLTLLGAPAPELSVGSWSITTHRATRNLQETS